MRQGAIRSTILRYVLKGNYAFGDQLPTIQEISRDLDVSIPKVRESLEVGRALGLIDVKPGRGMRVSPSYRFAPAVSLSALFAIAQDSQHFEQFRQMRNALEVQFWGQAVAQLQSADVDHLHTVIDAAQKKLAHLPIQVPAAEHRDFHLTIFSRLGNPFVTGVLEAYWEAYGAFGLNLYVSLDYHQHVWDYHRRIAEAIADEDFDQGRHLLVEHMNLLSHRIRTESAEPRPPLFYD
ncbi:MAG: FadR family transcriptional regulator [Chloroflexi bacterium]|nr:FadR family transcriptional regulator [Chloroflexota bacterium]